MMLRSKNRLREHGDHWKVKWAASDVPACNGPGVYLECDFNICRWFGWIPLDDAKELGIVPKCFEPKS